ncbi:MAG: DUF308 domain-containing protein [Thermoanaerobaculia bacterium]
MFEQLQEKPINRKLRNRWWPASLRAAVTLLLALAAPFEPVSALPALVILWGFYAFIDGAVSLVVGALTGLRSMLLVGVVGVAAGIFTLQQPSMAVAAFLVVVAAWAIVRGLSDLAASIAFRKELPDEGSLLLGGIVSVGFGALALGFPAASAQSIFWVIGVYGFVEGMLLVWLATRLYGADHGAELAGPN